MRKLVRNRTGTVFNDKFLYVGSEPKLYALPFLLQGLFILIFRASDSL